MLGETTYGLDRRRLDFAGMTVELHMFDESSKKNTHEAPIGREWLIMGGGRWTRVCGSSALREDETPENLKSMRASRIQSS